MWFTITTMFGSAASRCTSWPIQPCCWRVSCMPSNTFFQLSTVSRRLSALEESLGAKLFLRGPDGFSPTPAGDRLLPLAESMEAAVTAIDRQVAKGDERVEGTVRLTTSEVFSGFVVKRL